MTELVEVHTFKTPQDGKPCQCPPGAERALESVEGNLIKQIEIEGDHVYHGSLVGGFRFHPLNVHQPRRWEMGFYSLCIAQASCHSASP